MATIYDEFTLQNLAGIPAAINRIGATKAAIAQDAFLTQRAQQLAEQERRARQSAAVELFHMEQAMREASAERASKRSVEDTLKIFGVEQQAREASAERAREAAQENAEEMFLLQELTRQTGEERRSQREIQSIGPRAKALQDAQDAILEEKQPEIKEAWKNIEDTAAEEQSEIDSATAPIQIKPTDVIARFLASEQGQIEMTKLSQEQQQLVRTGNVAQVMQKLGAKKSAGLAFALDSARQELEIGARDLQKQRIDLLQDKIRSRPFNSGAQAQLLLRRFPGAEKFRPKGLPRAVPADKSALPLPPRGAAVPPTGAAADAFNRVTAPSVTTPGSWMSDKLAAIPPIVAQAMSRQLYGSGAPAASAIVPTFDPNQSAGAMFRLQSLLQGQPVQQQPVPTVSPWQSGASAFRFDPNMFSMPAPLLPSQVNTNIPDAYFSIGR